MPKKAAKDATERNIRASNKRDDKLLERIKSLEKRVKDLEAAVGRGEHSE